MPGYVFQVTLHVKKKTMAGEGSSGTRPLKRPRFGCIIHCSNDETDKLTSPESVDSWKTVLNAAEIRKHGPILEIAKGLHEDEIPQIQYHRKCRSIFTMKKLLQKLQASKEKDVEATDNEEATKRPSRQGPSSCRTYAPVCIFCQKENKYCTRQRTREPLVQCREIRADETVREAATRKVDSRVMTILSRDIVAAEGQYHRSCYRAYTREVDIRFSDARDKSKVGDDVQYEDAVNQSYSELFLFIRNDLVANPRVTTMAELSGKLFASMNSFGVEHVKDSTKKHIRRKLESEFGKSLHIFPDAKGKLLLCPDNLTVCELAKENQSLKTVLHGLQVRTEDAVAEAALQVRTDINTKETPTVWPPPVDRETEDAMIPQSVRLFLYYLLTGTGDHTHASQRVKRLVRSFAQDLVYAVTRGRLKPPKHIFLPFAVKSLTGNVELIQILNRLGHGIAYSQMEEVDTALCLQKVSLSKGDVVLPVNIYPGTFTTLAWDNIDRLEETDSGGGTSHRVNGIAVQAKSAEPLPTKDLPSVDKTKKRSIGAPVPLLATYNAGERVGPPQSKTAEAETAEATQSAREKNLVWIMARASVQEDQFVCGWTGFNILTRLSRKVSQDNIGYLPTINAPATQLSTVHEVLNQSLSIMQSLGLSTIVCVFDQALYAKAVEITWKHPDKFLNTIILRLGVFHTICTLLATIGKRFQDAGLRDLCVESGLIAEGSVAGVIEGRRYNRAVRLHKLVYEALLRLAWKGFLTWMETTHPSDLVHLDETLQIINDLCKDDASLNQVLKNKACARIMARFDIYLQFLRSGNDGLSAFWMSYLDMVEILLGLIRASREGDWHLHLASIRAMIPWCFAYDRLNYARYLPYYYAQMSKLPITHPDVYSEFMHGGFSVQLGPTNPFGRIPVDQTIEETVNKDTQTPGGTKGFSLKAGAVAKYYLTAEYRSQYLGALRAMTDQGSSKLSHRDTHVPRIKKDERDVQSVMDILENSWVNPMSPEEQDLVGLSTGTIATPDVTKDLLEAHQTGESKYQSFKQTRLDGDPPTVQFHDTMKKLNLKTFSSVGKKNVHGKKVQDVVKADRKLFGQMILVAERRNLHMRDVLKHPLGPLPWSLANIDSSLRKTNKSALAVELEKSVSCAEDIPRPSACVIDGMNLVYRMNGNNKTFAQLAESALHQVLNEGAHSQRIDVVFDVYRKTSIKDAERCKRGADTSTILYKNLSGDHNIQQWRKFLCRPGNKSSLIKFLVEQWKQPDHRKKLNGKTMYVTCEETCFRMTDGACVEVPELLSTQEEADTRLLLHALHAARSGSKAVVITAEDTDVMVICLGLHKDIPCQIYQKRGTQNRTRFVDITKLGKALGDSICNSLIGLHAFTGCDSVSAFAGRGKLGALKLLKKDISFQETFYQLGQSWDVSEELFERVQQFTCQMYTAGSSTTEVNELRYQLFCAKRGEVESSQLPPCRECLFMHVLRANYQAAIWSCSLQSQPAVPDPTESGWINDGGGQLAIHWMRTLPAPEVVLELLACKCTRSCVLPNCSCLANGLHCTDLCKLQTCSNQKQDDDPQFRLADSDSDSDEMSDDEL
eukprot:TRINITY_DN44663_c0_g1_i3.p1 TRINITY_DN44663_c0_g1~~TRINITY_DN44663_c0_g1_i3.p1  ORF type:complete len:1606 (-),score=395.32 TRINITY_DN44663_c0_g1_i3:590-5317(-)